MGHNLRQSEINLIFAIIGIAILSLVYFMLWTNSRSRTSALNSDRESACDFARNTAVGQLPLGSQRFGDLRWIAGPECHYVLSAELHNGIYRTHVACLADGSCRVAKTPCN